MTRVMITGTGGPAGVAILRSLQKRGDVEIVSADMDPFASGLYLVPPELRRLVPAGKADGFVDAVLQLCRELSVDVLFPTVDVELPLIAQRRAEFAAAGVRVASPELATLDVCLDKYQLARRCQQVVPVPRTELLGPAAAEGRQFPVIVKPRRGAGSRGIHLVRTREQLLALGTDQDQLVQDYLPGDEFSVDVLCDLQGSVIAAVPRSRDRVDSGVAVAGRTVRDPELEGAARAVAAAIGLTTVANVQLRRDPDGRAALLEVNPRFPGSMPLTVAAGVDMPSLTLDLVLGVPVPPAVDFRELAVVRYLEDVFFDPADLVRQHPLP